MSDGPAPTVRLRELVKRYRGRAAVDRVSLEVAPGEVYGLIGPDGAGKSSILKTAAGVLTFESGSVHVCGVSLDSERAAEQVKGRLGFMPQGLGLNLYPELSVDENVEFFGRLRLVPSSELGRRKERLLGITRLAAFRDRPMKQLSGGMKQKLGLVCTLVHEPELLILDEPTTGIDPVSRRDLWEVLAELMGERRVSALVATAYMDEASRFDRLAFVYGGRVLADGEPDAVRRAAPGRVVTVETDLRSHAEALGRLRARWPEATHEAARIRVLVPVDDTAAALAQVRTALGDTRIADATVDQPDLEDAFVGLLRDRVELAPALARDPGRVVAVVPQHPVIEASALTRDFGRFRAVDRATFQVRAGEVFGLLGANGAGKTTLIKMLTGILPPTAGAGRVGGVDMRRPSDEVKQRIGYVSQAFSLYQDLTAVENARLYAGIYGLSGAAARQRVEWALGLADLAGQERTPTARLPVGRRQRLALGCALMHRPQAIFLDEPTSGVDPLGRRRFWDIVFALAREQGAAVLITTHYMTEAEHCDRLALMFDGRIVADASPAELKRAVEAEAGRVLAIESDAPDRAARVLVEAGFHNAARHRTAVRVLCRDEHADERRLLAALAAAGIAVAGVERRPLTMEEVFVHRVTELERAAGRAA